MRAVAEDFESLERLDRGTVVRRSAEAVQILLRHAFDNVPHYRDILTGQGVSFASSLHAEDLARFPVLSREFVRDAMSSGRLLARGVPRRRRIDTQTTGSTGIPLRFYGDTHSRRERRSGWKLLNQWAGIQPGDQRVSMLVPRPRPAWSSTRPLRSLRKMIFFRQPSDLLSIYGLRADDVPGIVESLNAKTDPYHIYGVASAIQFIATRGLASGLHLTRPPRAVVGTTDTFGARHRDAVADFMQCPVYSRYGAYEVGGGVAQTCPDNPRLHHVLSELVIAEVVDDDFQPVAPGSAGRLLLTDLTNFVMPLIRYDIGDMAIAAECCPCGRPWPVLGEIAGRIGERIVLDNGEFRYGFELEVALFYYHESLTKDILEYQFVQHGLDELEMRVVSRQALDGGTLEGLRQALVEALHDRARVDVVPVERIDAGEGGKRRLVIQGS